MKTLDEVKKILQFHKDDLRRDFHVKEIGVFGSFSRGEQGEGSDIDIMVDFEEPIGWEFTDLNEYLEKILKLHVDLATPRALKPLIRDDILNDLVYV